MHSLIYIGILTLYLVVTIVLVLLVSKRSLRNGGGIMPDKKKSDGHGKINDGM